MPFLSIVRSAGVGQPQVDPAVLAFDPETATLQVRQEPALGLVVGVGHVVTHHRGFARYLTDSSHGSLQLVEIAKVLDCNREIPRRFKHLARRSRYRSPRSANDTVRVPATMKWSSILMSTSASACLSVCVSSSSARLGSATPDGWLCARITAGRVVAQRGLHDFARIDAGLRERAAEELLRSPITRFCASRNSATNTSCGRAAQRQRR